MSIRRAVPNILTDDMDAAKAFYHGFLGFDVAMDEPGFAMFASPSNRTAQITVADPTTPALPLTPAEPTTAALPTMPAEPTTAALPATAAEPITAGSTLGFVMPPPRLLAQEAAG